MRSFCAYEEYVNVTLIHHDELYENGSKSDCQELCDKSTMYNCRGFTILQMPNRSSPVCLLNSEDSKIYGPKLLRSNSQATYYERATCLNSKLILQFLKKINNTNCFRYSKCFM